MASNLNKVVDNDCIRRQFADATSLWRNINYQEIVKQMVIKGTPHFQSNLNRITKWFINNGFKIAAIKTLAIIFQKRPNAKCNYPKLKVDDTETEYKTKIKFLGVLFQNNHYWAEYNKNKCITAANKGIKLMKDMPN